MNGTGKGALSGYSTVLLMASLLVLIAAGCVSPKTQRIRGNPDQLAREEQRQSVIALESLLFDQMRVPQP